MSTGVDPELTAAVRSWIAEDPDPATRDELSALLAACDGAALADRFSGSLTFGTAGLRGALGGGPNRMNRLVVIRAAAGLSAYLRATGAGSQDTVVIGFDARHNSARFARDTAEVLAGAGLRPLLFPHPCPTPLLAFAIRDLGCVAGVMVTASHNPAQDNGYKVYLGDGSQIVPPADHAIAAAIAGVGPLDTIPRVDPGPASIVDPDTLTRYRDRALSLLRPGPRDLRIVYTPMHGVGGTLALDLLARAGFSDVHITPAQAEPDPDFPTVAFPNPEEPGALDLAVALAAELEADLVIANDPDADRCAVAIPAPEGWRMLRGDEVGVLLADHLLTRGRHGVYARSLVSSRQLAALADAAGQPHQETLTGFKWIGRLPGLVFGYEEALGYCVDPDVVKDKDGITALLLVAELAAEAAANGRNLTDLLDDLARRTGVYATDQISVRVTDLARIAEVMARFRSDPPTSLAGSPIVQADDLSAPSGDLPATDALRFLTADNTRVILRPSGTEPKLKCYLEVVEPLRPAGDPIDVATARTRAATRLTALRTELNEVIAR